MKNVPSVYHEQFKQGLVAITFCNSSIIPICVSGVSNAHIHGI